MRIAANEIKEHRSYTKIDNKSQLNRLLTFAKQKCFKNMIKQICIFSYLEIFTRKGNIKITNLSFNK